MNNSAKVAVIGAGISGLACAHRLQQQGVDVTVYESNSAAGGLIDSVEKDGLLFEAGPQSFQGTPALLDLIRELGLESQLQKADPRAPRYVLLHGRLRKVPMSPQALLTSTLLNPSRAGKLLPSRSRNLNHQLRKNPSRHSSDVNSATRFSNISSRLSFPAYTPETRKN